MRRKSEERETDEMQFLLVDLCLGGGVEEEVVDVEMF